MPYFSFFFRILAIILLINANELTASNKSETEHATRRLLSLVEYIGGDYTAAVQKGKVISVDEYKEMQEFSDAAQREFDKLSAEFKPEQAQELRANLTAIKSLILSKADASAIRALTDTVKNRVIDSLGVQVAPKQRPSRDTAVAHYSQTCASCHGADGHGDGPASKGLEPPPRNFHETEAMDLSSPFKFYNTLQLGVEGTSMVSYAKTYTENELWSLAFQAMALRHATALRSSMKLPAKTELPDAAALWQTLPEPTRQALSKAGLSLTMLARQTDNELRAWIKASLASVADAPSPDTILDILRVAAPYLPATPMTAENQSSLNQDNTEIATLSPGSPSDKPVITDSTVLAAAATFTLEHIDAAKKLFAEGDRQAAETKLLDAYLDGYEKLERTLAARHKPLVTSTEQIFIRARTAARDNDAATFSSSIEELKQKVTEAQTLLTQAPETNTWSRFGDFFASLVIILREGFEAFLVIAAILALLTKSGQASMKRYIHLGWISAVVAGFVSYYVFIKMFEISGAARETIEAVCTGLAAVMLFYVSFWLLNQTERTRWDRFLKKSAGSALNAKNSMRAFFFLAFIAVYREAAETVLFYSALGSSSSNQTLVVLGFIAGCAILLVSCWLIMKYGLRLPLRQFFLATSSAMILLSIVLAGKATKELIEAGFVQPTSIPHLPTIDALGIYPNWETVGTQLVAIALALGLAYLSVRTSRAAQTAS